MPYSDDYAFLLFVSQDVGPVDFFVFIIIPKTVRTLVHQADVTSWIISLLIWIGRLNRMDSKKKSISSI